MKKGYKTSARKPEERQNLEDPVVDAIKRKHMGSMECDR
jgi:hypothetical protein